MKKALLILFVLAFAPATFGQVGSITGLGVKGHVGYAALAGDDAEGTDPVIGFAFGAFADYFLTEHVNLTPELHFVQRGYSTTTDLNNESIGVDHSYVGVPLMVKYSWQMNEMRPFLQLGPEFGILVGANADGTDISDHVASFDVGLNVGGGLQVTQRWGVDLRYYFGLTSLDPGDGDEGAFGGFGGDEEADVRNTGAMIGITYNFLAPPGR